MQSNALYELYRLEKEVKKAGNEKIISDWRKLQTSDHFYYMCTKWFADGDVHKYFNPYDSPYDSYINFMNVLGNLHKRCSEATNGNVCCGLAKNEIQTADYLS
jgi:alpha-amylase